MKIAFLNYYQEAVDRGLETYVDQLSGRLVDHQVLVLSGPDDAQVGKSTLTILRRFFLDKASLKICRWTFSVLPRLAKFNPDIVLGLNNGWQTAILRIWTWLKGKSLVLVGQSGPGWDDRWNLLWKPNAFVCLTQSQLSWAKKASIYKNQYFSTIPNGVDLKKFSLEGRTVKLKLERPIIICVAASQKYKRVGETIKAVSQLKKGSLLFLGKGPLDEHLDNLAQRLLGEKRYLHTTTSHNQMPKYYRSADLFTLVSQSSEAFGIVYLEALASGLPVVATDDFSRHEIVGPAGLYIDDPSDTDRYARLLRSALEKNWRNLPRKQAKKFDWDKIAEEYIELFTNL